ncbi:MAG: universal stress protein [Dehalococcoidales bacterium]|nr:universal stress protein [Dehalococcoidales bacterium]
MFNRILVYLDGSKFAEEILPYVIEQATSFRSEVFLLKVNTAPQYLPAYSAMPGMVAGGASAGWAIKLEELETKSYLEETARKLSKMGLNVIPIAHTGPIVDIVLKIIKDNAIDLIAMASQTYKGWKRLFLGSITENILRECDIPLLVINPYKDHKNDNRQNE